MNPERAHPGDPLGVAGAMRDAVKALDNALPVSRNARWKTL